MRGLKRRISDALYRQLFADAQPQLIEGVDAGPGGHRGASQISSAAGSHPHTGTSDQPLPGPAPTTLPPPTTTRKSTPSSALRPAPDQPDQSAPPLCEHLGSDSRQCRYAATPFRHRRQQPGAILRSQHGCGTCQPHSLSQRRFIVEGWQWLVAVGIISALVLIVVLVRGRIKVSISQDNSGVGVEASRSPRPGGTAKIARSQSTDGGARAEGSSAEISRTQVKGNLIAKATDSSSETRPKSQSTEQQSGENSS
jgi:hypothetical protein